MLRERKYFIFEAPDSIDEMESSPKPTINRKFLLGTYNKKLVSGILKYNGWTQTSSNDYNLLWMSSTETDVIAPMSKIQSINHYPFSKKILGNKAELAAILQGSPHINKFDHFFPTTYVLPRDREALFRYMKANPNEKFISKPPQGSCGHGIKLVSFQDFYTIPSGSVICEYISRPLCIDNFKFDLRIYVLVTSWAPLRAFIYREGLARFATETYSRITENPYAHLTNATLNKKNRNYSDDFKWKLSELLAEVQHRFKKSEGDLMNQIIGVVSQTLALVQPSMAPDIRLGYDTPFFELYGFDILLDRDFNTYLLEINTYPSLSFDEEVDFEVKAPLIAQALSIAGVPDMDYEELRDSNNLISVEPENVEEMDQLAVKLEDERNEASGDGFIRLFPADYNDDLYEILAYPKYEQPKRIVKHEDIDPREIGRAFTSKQGLDLLGAYLAVLMERVENGCAGERTIKRLNNFLYAQGYSVRHTRSWVKATLGNYIERTKQWVNGIRSGTKIPEKVKLKILDSGDAFVEQILTNCEMRHVKNVETLFV